MVHDHLGDSIVAGKHRLIESRYPQGPVYLPLNNYRTIGHRYLDVYGMDGRTTYKITVVYGPTISNQPAPSSLHNVQKIEIFDSWKYHTQIYKIHHRPFAEATRICSGSAKLLGPT